MLKFVVENSNRWRCLMEGKLFVISGASSIHAESLLPTVSQCVFFSKFISPTNNSNKYRPSEFSRRDKILSSKFIPKCAGPFMYVNLGNFFSAEIRKMTFVIFETNVSSRKPCVWTSKASFAQKLQEFCRQNFISSRELRTGKISVWPKFSDHTSKTCWLKP